MPGRRIGPRKRLALELFSGLYADKVREHRLDTLFWECTLRCNLACRHCGSDCRTDPGVKDMPAEDFLRVLDEEVTPHVDPAGVLVILSGGEVLVRDDLERIGSEIARRGYPWGMVTNGLALTPERLHGLIRAGLRTISVSLDGFERGMNQTLFLPQYQYFQKFWLCIRHALVLKNCLLLSGVCLPTSWVQMYALFLNYASG